MCILFYGFAKMALLEWPTDNGNGLIYIYIYIYDIYTGVALGSFLGERR